MSNRSLARLVPLITLVVLFVLSMGGAAPALGASFTVDATHDAVDASPGDGVCADAGGACTLRAAVMETNALAEADEISLPPGTYVLSIAGAGEDAGATGDLDVTDDLTLTAPVIVNGASEPSAVVDGGGLDRVLQITSGAAATISGVTIRNGRPEAGGGGIANDGSLVLSIVAVTDNRSIFGAGIHNRGALTLTHSNIRRNIAIPSPPISFPGGGGILNEANLAIDDSTVADNQADDGGGISSSGALALTRVTVSGNTASGEAPHGIAGGGRGGGIISFAGSITAENVTISGNEAAALDGLSGGSGGLGGGIFGGAAGNWSLINVTIAENFASSLPGASQPEDEGEGGGILYLGGGEVSLRNTIVARNQATRGGDCSGPITSLGHNLDSDGTCSLTGPGDISNADPLIAPLADNGGPTQTHALIQGGCPTDACIVPSPAIDAGDAAACPGTDQRGEPRPFDGDGDGVSECDVGAYEVQEPPLTCTGPCGPIPTSPTPTPSPATSAPTPTAALPSTLPSTGGDASAPKGIPLVLAAAAIVVAGSAVWRVRRGRKSSADR
jgi:hypothetical protein